MLACARPHTSRADRAVGGGGLDEGAEDYALSRLRQRSPPAPEVSITVAGSGGGGGGFVEAKHA